MQAEIAELEAQAKLLDGENTQEVAAQKKKRDMKAEDKLGKNQKKAPKKN